ncbi:hypothetical protein QVD17_32408 [Tagetes erecta]|uniref:Uncharacterized protein n=1 Tax=Tagetes erecta TaxID=13708 RepID=A0AAD8K5K6_TARER|nr:hypothetical protein QVD17_32408 [Tagetes erecta]
MLLLRSISYQSSHPATIRGGVVATRPLEEKSGYVMYKPPKASNFEEGQGHVDGCLPKGFGHNSGPSRYINYQTLTTASTPICSTTTTSTSAAPPKP